MKSVAGEKRMKMLIYYQSGDELHLNPEVKSSIVCVLRQLLSLVLSSPQKCRIERHHSDKVLCLGSCWSVLEAESDPCDLGM